ncbi:dicarboxylate/amino acid:cation symporter [Acanthopleuribacter pedis]|uniref:Dicarboxylate/amino acid:cation symporter n=1 Tax=Acanthopleuribacter pedis TaxID=442870 RepID=A0A8J7QM06_9BACT|nr:dicarboxylate/amino acid:cation symporter [Acanthopleuribacter pedis]MBO1320440.1 dicarboxylate/amino acid:cation symporter [Acanthopleuribacter pedis]
MSAPSIGKMPLHTQIFIAMLVGALLGCLMRFGIPEPLRYTTGSAWVAAPLIGLGKLFISLLKMVIVPLVGSSIVVGIASIGDSKNLGRLGIKTLLFYTMTSLFAITIGLVASNVMAPGRGVELPETGTKAIDPSTLNTPGSPFEIIFRMIPTNPVQALAEMDMLGIIFFSLIFGITLTTMPSEHRDRILNFINSLFETMMKMTGAIIALAPFGVVGLVFTAIYEIGDLKFFKALGAYFLTILFGVLSHLFIALPLLLFVFTRKSPIKHFAHMRNALLTAFSTSSSSATLPVTMECVEEEAGVSNKISSFVLPLGATVNMDGTALYECAGVLFIAQVMGVDLSFFQQMTVVITALLASIGAAGIPSAGLVMIFIVLDAVGLKGDQVGVIVGTMLAIDRPLDMLRTATNVFSDSVGAVIIAHSEGEIETKPS